MPAKTRKKLHGTRKLSPQNRFFLQKACQFAANVRIFSRHFVNGLFVFIQIAASIVPF